MDRTTEVGKKIGTKSGTEIAMKHGTLFF